MAKSFKKLAAPAPSIKRTSEKDILDFLEQDRSELPSHPALTVDSSEQSSSLRAKTNTVSTPSLNNIDNTNNINNINDKSTGKARKDIKNSNISNISNTIIYDVTDVEVRQTFSLGQRYLEKLKNLVHTRRIQGQYDFTQKQALHEALDLLFADKKIEERPAQIREKEEIRKQQIRKGRLK